MQRVNFYQERFRPRSPFLSLRTVVLAGLLLLLCLGAISGELWYDWVNQQEKWARQVGQGVTVAASARNAGLRQCRQAWEQQAVAELGGHGWPVTPLLELLAEVHRTGIGLTKIEIAQEGRQLLIQGDLLPGQAEQLPHYLQALAHHSRLVVQDVRLEKELPTTPAAPGRGGVLLKFRLVLGTEGRDGGLPDKRSAP
ncbi:MAG: hypothetical protein HQL88_10135 [Magnetococcales bacterium]|nr:hypothetical protein [Magnetococcales bacterium]